MLCLLLTQALAATTVEGVEFPDSVMLGGQKLQLNGAGLREEFLVDIYAGAVYLPGPCQSGAEIIQADVAKRFHVEFVFPLVTAGRLKSTLHKNFERYPELPERSKTEMLAAFTWLPDFYKGDTMTIDYVPTKGTTLLINGKAAGHSEGNDLMIGMFTLFFGDKPTDAGFKLDLLGSSGQKSGCFL